MSVRKCIECDRVRPINEFITKNGKNAPSCRWCRHRWIDAQRVKWAKHAKSKEPTSGTGWRRCAACAEPFPIADFLNDAQELTWRCPDCRAAQPKNYAPTRERSEQERARSARGYTSPYRRQRG